VPRVDQNKPPKWTTLECQNQWANRPLLLILSFLARPPIESAPSPSRAAMLRARAIISSRVFDPLPRILWLVALLPVNQPPRTADKHERSFPSRLTGNERYDSCQQIYKYGNI